MEEQSRNPLQYPPTGGGGGHPGGGGGHPGGQPPRTAEELEQDKSRWTYKEYFEPKDTKAPTYPEFMHAALRWGAEATAKATAKDLRGYLGHLAYIAGKAAVENSYVSEAHILYDDDVWKKC